MEIKLIDRNNFTRDSLKDFQRYQEVKNVYRLQNGNLTLVYNPFTEDWDAARLIEKAEEILSGRYVTYCAYEGNRVVGEIMLKKMGEQCDIHHVHPHKFRRTMATTAIDKGMPIEQVQRLLGHEKIDTTLHYAMVKQSNVKSAHRKYIG